MRLTASQDWSGLQVVFGLGQDPRLLHGRVFTGGEDIDFANRLMQAGVPVEPHVYPGVFHGWDIMAPDAAVTRRAMANRQAAMKRALHP